MVTSPTCFILVGFVGSGKSTLSNVLKAKHNALVLSTDDYVMKKAFLSGETYNEAFEKNIKAAEKEFNSSIKDAISSKRNVIIDRTNLTIKSRKKIIDKFKAAGYKVIAVVVRTSKARRDEVNHQRSLSGREISDSVRNRMEKSYQEPSVYEGFDKILLIGTSNE